MTLALELPWQVGALGAFNGLTYGLLAIGLILVFRATGILNLAHGEIGALGAAVLAYLVADRGLPWIVAFVGVVLLGGAIGALISTTVMRRLGDAPRLIALVATVGIAQLLLVLQLLLPDPDQVRAYPAPFEVTWSVAPSLVLTGSHIAVLAIVPLLVVAVARFLQRTRYGVAIRAAADNADAARLAGIPTRRVSLIVWGLAGALATVTIVLVAPLQNLVPGSGAQALGPGLLLRALTAALVGRFVSLPLAVAGGVAVGVAEGFLNVNVATGTVDVVIFATLLVLVWTQRRSFGGGGSLAVVTAMPLLGRRAEAALRRVSRTTIAVAAAVAVCLPFVITRASEQFELSRLVLIALIGLSVVVVTGWSGQLSLAQFAFAGFGAAALLGLTRNGVPFTGAVVYATVAAAAVAVIVGSPALRVRGLFLAVTTLGFAVAAGSSLIGSDAFFDGQATGFVPRTSFLGIDLGEERSYYFLSVAALALSMVATNAIRRSGTGRAIIAVRDNERAAEAFGISPTVTKLTAFTYAGALAGLGGALLAGLTAQITPVDFKVGESLDIVAMVIIGGVTSTAGAVVGAVYLLGLPAILGDRPEVALLTSGVGVLLLVLYLPGGLVDGFRRLVVRFAGADAGATVDNGPALAPAMAGDGWSTVGTRHARARSEIDAPGDPLVIRALVVRFGGLVAVDHVDLQARRGEIVGLIGSNGAGKSTLMDAVSGFAPIAGGTIELHGAEVTPTPPYERARRGLGRVFQDARLFDGLTVLETLCVAQEVIEPSEFIPSLLALGPSRRAERRKQANAAEIADLVGLGPFLAHTMLDLSTGTRRIVELATLLVTEPSVVLLDEPTAGLAQRETEAFGPLIVRVRDALDATVVLIEHDMPLVMAMSHRMYCMSAGRIIAEGSPTDVRADPEVVAAYLGTDERAIARSGTSA